jgi:hypothetical protein
VKVFRSQSIKVFSFLGTEVLRLLGIKVFRIEESRFQGFEVSGRFQEFFRF